MGMFTELLQQEIWKKKLEKSGYKINLDATEIKAFPVANPPPAYVDDGDYFEVKASLIKSLHLAMKK